jgi:hypothetical protein
MTKGCDAGSVVWKSFRRFWRTLLKQAMKGAPTCDSLELVSTVYARHWAVCVPVMAHGVEDRIVKLNWPGDEERGMGLLVRFRHPFGWFWVRFPGWFWFYPLDWLCLLFGLLRLLGLWALDISAFVFKARAAFGGEGRIYLEERGLAG